MTDALTLLLVGVIGLLVMARVRVTLARLVLAVLLAALLLVVVGLTDGGGG